MCVAIIITGDSRPTLAELRTMHNQNPDGAGIGWVQDGVCKWAKGLNPDTLDVFIDKVPRPALVHFRWATVGGTTPSLCHPFPMTLDQNDAVTGESDEILIHNGHWADWEEYYKTYVQEVDSLPAGAWSDTRFAAYLMARFPEDRDTIAAEVGGRVAVLSGLTGEASYYGDWTEIPEQPGVMYSNTYWRTSQRGYGIRDQYDWWSHYLKDADDKANDNEPDWKETLGSGKRRRGTQYSGSSHRYRPMHGYSGHNDLMPPLASADDMAWEAYWAKKKALEAAERSEATSLFSRRDYESDEPTEPGGFDSDERMTHLTATQEFSACQSEADNAAEACSVASRLITGSETHQLIEVQRTGVNGQTYTVYEMVPKESV